MKRNKIAAIAALVLFGLAISSNAAADRRGHQSGHSGRHGGTYYGVYLGVWPGYYGLSPYAYYPPYPYYYPPYPYYYPPVVAAPAEPTTYIEQGEVQAQAQPAQPSNYWYYCDKPQGYYPYVKQCPGGWQKVSPQPPEP